MVINYYKEFEKLVNALNSIYIDISILYKSPKERNLYGITYLGKNSKIIIYISNKTNNDYKNALITLIHEYGHIVDEEKNKECKRLLDYYSIINYSFIKKYYCNMTQKKHYLLTEYFATKYGKFLLQKFDINLKEDDLAIDQTVHYKFLYENIINKYEMSYSELENYKKDIIYNDFRINTQKIKKLLII